MKPRPISGPDLEATPSVQSVTDQRTTYPERNNRSTRALRPVAALALVTAFLTGTGLTALRLRTPESLWAIQAVAFTPWAVVAIIVALGLGMAQLRGLLRLVTVGLCAALLGLHLAWQAPLYLGEVPQPDGVKPLRVLSINALLGQADPERIVFLVRERNVELLTVQEITPALLSALEEEGLAALLPYRAGEPQGGAGGTMVFSATPLGEARDIHSGNGVWLVTADTRFGPLRLLAVHTRAPTSAAQTWLASQREVRDAAGGADVLAGDFNATRDHASIAALHEDGFATSAELANGGLRETWPMNRTRSLGPIPLPPLAQIDHVMVRTSVWTTTFTGFPDVAGSDHRAVIADLIPIDSIHDGAQAGEWTASP